MSTSLALGLVGAAIGSAIPGVGTSWGWMIGSALGAAYDFANAPDTQGPRLQDRAVQISSYGAAIPIVFGSERIAGNVIWPKNFVVDEHSETQSAKGGPEQTTYTYTATFAILLGKRPIAGVRNMWMNKKLVIDENGKRDRCISGMRVYLGTETQDPDPLMVARDGSAPGYRGYAYIVFEDLELTQSGFGNRPPSIEVEVFTNGGAAVIPPPLDFADQTGTIDTRSVVTYNASNGTILTSSHTGTDLDTISVVDPIGQTVVSTVPITNTGAFSNNRQSICYVTYSVDLVEHIEVWAYDTAEFSTQLLTIIDPATGMVIDTLYPTLNSFTGPITFHEYAGKVLISQSNTSSTIHVFDPATRNELGTVDTSPTQNGIYHIEAIPGEPYVVQWDDTYNKVIITKWVGAYTSIAYQALGFTLCGFAYDSTRRRIVFVGSTDITYFDLATEAFVTVANPNAAFPGLATASAFYFSQRDEIYVATASSNEYYQLDAASFLLKETIAGGSVVINGLPVEIPGVSDYFYVVSSSGGQVHNVLVYVNAAPTPEPVTLASIVQAICTMEPFGLDAGDIDVSELTDLVPGYLIGQQMTRRAAIEPLQAAYFFDGVESDHVLKFVKRGQPPAVTIPLDDRAAHEDGAEMPPHLAITRASELELPWMIDLNYTDQASDYQVGTQYDRRITRNANSPMKLDLPIVMSAEKAKQVAIVNLYQAWLRVKFGFSTGLAYAKYEPTDVVTLPTEDVTYIARIVSRSDQGNGVIQWEAQLEDIAIYTQTGIVAASNFVPQTIADPGSTILELLDMPILRDMDDNAGYYVAMGGTTDGWRGAQLYKSADGGSTYDPMLAITSEAAIGTAQSALGNFTAGNIFDEGNSVTVQLRSGGALISATETQVLNGSNTAVIGATGRWEVINFKNASLIATDTYTLSGLLRGRRGTEWATGTHAAGDTFVLASVSTWQRPNPGSAELGLARLYKAPPFRTLISAATAQSFTDTGVGLKPYSPVDVIGERDGSDNLTISWHRRSRIGYGTLNAIVPLGEASENYQIQIMDGADIKRTLTSTSESVVYSASDQTSDWGSTTGPYTVRVAQVSAVVGAGYQEEEELA